ncbi:MAG: site-specific integrase [Gammaproteobacteria bacterium]|nr:site-specific integrase [Gammaproteobacteria bacterium]
MAKFRSPKPPERQAREVTGALVNLGALRRNPARPASLRTVENYRDCLLQVARRIAADGRELRDLTPETAEAHLRSRTGELGQKALDMHRQALQAMLVHVSRRLPQGKRLEVIRSERPGRYRSRAYTPAQVRRVAAAQTPRNALATLVAHAAGLRAHELLTLARPAEQPADPRPTRESKFAGRPGADYTVVGKGGLVRIVRLPEHLALRLEERRREKPATVMDRGIRYLSRYDVGGGRAWGASFSAASMRYLGWSRGAHGLRHSYAQERTAETGRLLPRDAARETVSQELGHFRASVTDAYLK